MESFRPPAPPHGLTMGPISEHGGGNERREMGAAASRGESHFGENRVMGGKRIPLQKARRLLAEIPDLVARRAALADEARARPSYAHPEAGGRLFPKCGFGARFRLTSELKGRCSPRTPNPAVRAIFTRSGNLMRYVECLKRSPNRASAAY